MEENILKLSENENENEINNTSKVRLKSEDK